MFDIINNVAKRMLLDFEDSKKSKHSGLKGRAREKSIVRQFLSQYLPKRYSISSGVIVDVDAKESKQQDIVIYDSFCSPVLKDLEDEKIFFPENVLSAIEVKSSLSKRELIDTYKKAESIYGLSFSPNPAITLTPQIVSKAIKPPILTIGFAYNAKKSLDSIRDDLREIKKTSSYPTALSFLCVLEDKDGKSGLIIHVNKKNINQITVLPNEKSRLAVLNCDDPGSALMYMYLLIMTCLQMNGIFTPTPNFSEYAKATGLSSNQISMAKEDLPGAYFNFEGQDIAIDDAFLMSELTKKLFSEGLTDNELMDFQLAMIRMPKMQFIVHPNARYFEVIEKNNVRLMDLPSPRKVIQSIQSIKSGNTNEEDQRIFHLFKNMMDRIGNKELTIEIRKLNT